MKKIIHTHFQYSIGETMPFLDWSQISYPINTRDPKEIRINCIYCNDESYHCYVNLKKKVFHCFRCGVSGKTNIDDERITNQYLTEKDESLQHETQIRLPEAIKTDHKLTMRAIKYLARRGIFESDVERHGLFCAAPKSIYFGRLIIPSKRRGNFASYFCARAYTNIAFPKYLNPPGGKRAAFQSPEEPDRYFPQFWPVNELMLVEGPFDMLKASRHGPTIALLGKELMPHIARDIISRFTKVRIMLDQGIREHWAAIKVQELLKCHIEVEVIQCPKKDPGDMDEKDFEAIFT